VFAEQVEVLAEQDDEGFAAGNADAQFILGVADDHDKRVTQDSQEAFRYRLATVQGCLQLLFCYLIM
jgi:hypothetical protein